MGRVAGYVLALTLLGPSAASAECPWSPEDANDNAKILAHQECKEAENEKAEQRFRYAETAVSQRIKALLDIVPERDRLQVATRQAAWRRASEACPPTNNGLMETPERFACLEQDYWNRAELLDALIAECRAGTCDLGKL
jgi:hypothetical protein